MPAGTPPSPHVWAELNLLNLVGALPELEGARLARAGTTVYDLNGEPLFLRVRLEGSDPEAFVDAAIDSRLGAPLLAVSYAEWDPDDLLDEAAEILRERKRAVTYDEARFVAFSFPKLAIQFLRSILSHVKNYRPCHRPAWAAASADSARSPRPVAARRAAGAGTSSSPESALSATSSDSPSAVSA